MAEIKWIKITTDIFSDEKIMLIEQMPDADTILVIWFKLLCMAGRDNNNGIFLLNNRIPYTEEMLATIFRRPIATVRLAISTFEAFGMVDIIDDVITLNNWEKHQNIDGMDKIRAQTRKRVAEYRERQKKLIACNDVTLPNATVTEQNKKEDKDKEEEKDNNILPASDEAKPSKKPVKHKYGEYNNVLLTDEELEKLKTEYSDYQERIERLSSYVASTGKSYKSHYATIRNWARKDAEKPQVVKKNTFNNFNQRSYEADALERMLLNNQRAQRVADDPKLQAEADELKKMLQENY